MPRSCALPPALTIAALPLLSVAIEAVLTLLGKRDFFDFRLQGMTGNAAVFALLAFTGFAVATLAADGRVDLDADVRTYADIGRVAWAG